MSLPDLAAVLWRQRDLLERLVYRLECDQHAPVLWINSADDYINPPELGIAERMVKEMPKGKFILIPISDATRGHGTHTVAAIWKNYLAEFMQETESR